MSDRIRVNLNEEEPFNRSNVKDVDPAQNGDVIAKLSQEETEKTGLSGGIDPMDIACPNLADLALSQTGELPEPYLSKVRQHVIACAECKQALERADALTEAFGVLVDPLDKNTDND